MGAWETRRMRIFSSTVPPPGTSGVIKIGEPNGMRIPVWNWDKDDDTLEFFTAWSSVPTILEALSRKYPDQTISYCWADEDIGSNVGEAVYKNGEMIDANIPEPGSREAYELASDIMGIDLADFDLYLSADKSTYEYHEDPPKTKRTKDGPAR